MNKKIFLIASIGAALIFLFAVYKSESTRLGNLNATSNSDDANFDHEKLPELDSQRIAAPRHNNAKAAYENYADQIFYRTNARSSTIIGRWHDHQDYLLYIYKTVDDKYFLTALNSQATTIEADPYVSELTIREINGDQVYQEKKYLGEINTLTGQRWSDADKEFTDYYQADANGDLILADKDGVILRYRKAD